MEVAGECKLGQKVSGRVVDEYPGFLGSDEPHAWGIGSRDWIEAVGLVVMFTLAALLLCAVAATPLFKAAKRRRRHLTGVRE